MTDLFQNSLPESLIPLAEKLRPKSVNEIFGQEHLTSKNFILNQLIKNKQLSNLIFWGPAGSGKTTLARSLASLSDARWIQLNAVESGVKELKSAGDAGKEQKLQFHRKTLLFVDEIHRFNRGQQDVLLPYLEAGDLYLIGATTENPSYELNRALLSRCHVLEFKRLETKASKSILDRCLVHYSLKLTDIFQPGVEDALIEISDGDGRRLINIFETVMTAYNSDLKEKIFPLSLETLGEMVGHSLIHYDKRASEHYDNISAFIKSMRGSDPDAALYYCARMLEGGEDPKFIARRMIIFASEDVGNADPRALPLAMACFQAVEALGMPECRINIGQTVCYLASAPKSNSSYLAINKAFEFVKKSGSQSIPEYLRSNSSSGNYKYPHNFEKPYVAQNYWPEQISPVKFYEPKGRGYEKNILDYLDWLKK